MKELKTEIRIKATPETVWGILADFDKYPDWNPFIRSVSGIVAVGNKITVRLEPPGASGMTFSPRVLVFDKNREFRWLGNLIFPGLFDGEHKFELFDNGDGTTTFRQSEIFKGILVPLFKNMLDIKTINGFNEMNNKLKELAEQK
jgi:hypothetical protein